MRILSQLVGLAALLAVLVAGTSAEAQMTMRLGNIYPADHSIGKGTTRFAELVAKKSNGQIKVEVFHDSALGSEREVAESVKAGMLDLCVSGLAGVGRFAQALQVVELPYLYRDLDQIQRVGQAIRPDLENLFGGVGLRVLAFYYLGPRDMVARRPIRGLDDMRGLKFRVPESPMYVGMARALGANPTPIAFPEVYMALQSGVVEAAEGGVDTLWFNKWYEPAKQVALTHHILQLFYLTMNDGAFQKLNPAQRQALVEAGWESAEYQLDQLKMLNTQSLDKMKSAGATVIPIPDVTPFVNALAPFNQKYAEGLGPGAANLLQRIKELK
jgi:tripartite ATP-independent transporter DctP family solute receptor